MSLIIFRVSICSSSASTGCCSGLQNSCFHSSSKESRSPGPRHTRNSKSHPFWMRCSWTIVNRNLRRPLYFEHGQWTCFRFNSLARCTPRVHRQPSLNCCRRLSIKGSVPGTMVHECQEFTHKTLHQSSVDHHVTSLPVL
jgi:hypothetical protein